MYSLQVISNSTQNYNPFEGQSWLFENEIDLVDQVYENIREYISLFCNENPYSIRIVETQTSVSSKLKTRSRNEPKSYLLTTADFAYVDRYKTRFFILKDNLELAYLTYESSNSNFDCDVQNIYNSYVKVFQKFNVEHMQKVPQNLQDLKILLNVFNKIFSTILFGYTQILLPFRYEVEKLNVKINENIPKLAL